MVREWDNDEKDYFYDFSACLPSHIRDNIVNRLYNEFISRANLQMVLQEIVGKDVEVRQFFFKERQATIQRDKWRFTIYWKQPYGTYRSRNVSNNRKRNNAAYNTARRRECRKSTAWR